ncbi:MAG: hypothetical protein IEMM0002_1329 [bacterium]|nr:MAG: hypothetical protein IEMM0002_1329 [bacterium]
MNVWIKKINTKIDIKNNGIELEVCAPSGKRLGDLVISKAEIIWCKGRIDRKNGKKYSWSKFIDHMESK